MNRQAIKDKKVKNLHSKRFLGEVIFFAVIAGFPLLQFCVFYIGVNFNSVLMAFQGYDAVTDTYQFIGFENFSRFFTEWETTGIFNYALRNSVIAWVFTFGIGTSLGLIFAYYIARKKPGGGLFKTILFLPNVVSGIVLVVIFKAFTDSCIPAILQAIDGNTHLGLIQNSDTTFGTIIFYNIWISFGTTVIMYSGAIGNIDEAVFEAAKLDGASEICIFFRVVLPLIYPSIIVFFTAGIAGIFTNQLNLYSFFGENAQPRLYTFGYYLYRNVQIDKTGSGYGYLSAIGIMLTLVVAPITLFARKLLMRVGPSTE